MIVPLRTRRNLPRLPVSTPQYYGEESQGPDRAGPLLLGSRSLDCEAQSDSPQCRGLGRRCSLVLKLEATVAKKEPPERIRRLNELPPQPTYKVSCRCR